MAMSSQCEYEMCPVSNPTHFNQHFSTLHISRYLTLNNRCRYSAIYYCHLNATLKSRISHSVSIFSSHLMVQASPFTCYFHFSKLFLTIGVLLNYIICPVFCILSSFILYNCSFNVACISSLLYSTFNCLQVPHLY
jgi:hypothetical protein